MAVKITDLGPATLPLAGTEQLEIVQDGDSKRVSADDLAAAAAGLDATFVTVTANPNLPNERILTAGTNVSIVDDGPGLPITISVSIPDQNPFATALGILGDINTATPPAAEAITALLELRDLQDVNIIGLLGYEADNNLVLDNKMRGGDIRIITHQAGGAEVFSAIFNPDGAFNLRHGATNQSVIISVGTALGGIVVPNSVTGTGANGRVRTPPDHAANEIEWEFDTSTDMGTSPDLQDLRMNNTNPSLVTEIAVNQSDIAGQVFDQFWGAELVSGDKIFIIQPNSQDNWIQLELTGVPVDQGSYWTMPVSVISNGTIFDTGRLCRAAFSLVSLGTGGAPADPTQLVDGAANVAVIAEGLGITAIRSIGNIDAEGRELEWQLANGTTRFSIGNEFFTDMLLRNHITGSNIIFRVGVGGGNRIRLHLSGDQANGGVTLYAGSSAVGRLATSNEGVRIQNGTLFLAEQAAAEANDAGFGQLFVDSADDALHYITEAGVDLNLSTGVFDPTLDQTISGHWEFTDVQGVDFGPSCELDLRNNADDSSVFIQNLGPVFQFGIAGGDFGDGVFQISQSSFARVECPVIFIGEQAAAEADISQDGQVWVRTDAFSNTLMFTNDNGNDIEVAGLPLCGDALPGTLVLATATFAGVVNIGPNINHLYRIIITGEVTAPTIDDIKLELTVDTNSVFKGVYTDSDGQNAAIESVTGEVITNTIVVPTDGSATPNGVYFQIIGMLQTGGVAQTFSLRAAKNADGGADGGIHGTGMSVQEIVES